MTKPLQIKTLRGQLLVRVMAVLALLLVVLGISQYVLLGQYLQKRAADGLRQQFHTVLTTALAGNAILDPVGLARALVSRDTAVRILTLDGQELAAIGPVGHELTGQPPTAFGTAEASFSPGERPPHTPDTQVQSIGGEHWLVLTAVTPPPVLGVPVLVLIGTSLREQEASLGFLAWLIALGGGAGLALAGIASWKLMGGALQPLTRLVEAAGAIAGGDWERRVAPGGSHEIDEAASAFNRMVDRLQVAFDAERAQQERMRAFLADAAHELRTPLTAMNGFVEIMQAGAVGSPEARERALAAMHSEGERMARLIRDLLQIARLERPDHGALPMTELDLAAMLQGLQPLLAAADPLHPVLVAVAGPAPILGNADGLTQVVWNLVENARRYSPEGAPVAIDCRVVGDRVSMTISDRGSGIPAADLPHVFERFWRGDASRQRKTGGTGLGLSIVQALVRAHDGEIDLRSVEGEGTTVELTFPLHT